MSDLQCPAIVVLVPDAARVASLPASRFRVADVREFPVPGNAGHLESFVCDLADEFRGECVAVVAPERVVRSALEGRGIPVPTAVFDAVATEAFTADGAPATSYVAVAVDSGGWTLLP